MTPSEPGRDQPSRSARWVRWLGFTPATQWSIRRRVVYGVFAVLMVPALYFFAAVTGPHARGPWFGALAVLIYADMFGWVILAPRHYDSWQRKHNVLDAAFFGPLRPLGSHPMKSIPPGEITNSRGSVHAGRKCGINIAAS